MSFQVGHVRVENGLITVRHTWELNFTAVQGGLPYTPAETVTWNGATGTGKFVSNDTVGNILRIYRTSGVEPVVGDTILGSSSGATTVVTSLPASSPPDYDNPTTGIKAAGKFNVLESGVMYTVSSTIGNDSFDLTTTFAEPSIDDALYQVVNSFSSFFSWDLPELGDLDSVSIVREALTSIDERLKFRGYFQQVITSSGGTASIDWRIGHGAGIVLTEATTLTFTAPAGPGELILKVTQDPATKRDITWPGTAKWPLGAKPALSLVPLSSVSIIRFYYDGTNYHGTFVTDSK